MGHPRSLTLSDLDIFASVRKGFVGRRLGKISDRGECSAVATAMHHDEDFALNVAERNRNHRLQGVQY